MPYSHLPVGANPPFEVNVIIENPMGGDPVKYELDKDTGIMFVDRFLHTPMRYPGNYGFIPKTLSGDGDPVDVLVVSSVAVIPGVVLRSRPVGVLLMEDDGGVDEKIIAVPTAKLYPYHDNIENLTDLRPILLEQIKHFFTHYKDLEKGKWSRPGEWGDVSLAHKLIQEGIERAKQK
jgi:inorganic pyrophosphatase